MAARQVLTGEPPRLGPARVAVIGAGCDPLAGLGDALTGAGRDAPAGPGRLIDLRCPAGARSAFSAPGPGDPVVPDGVAVVVVAVDAAALGRVIADRCDRALRVAALAGCSPWVRLTVWRAASALCNARGYLGWVPPGARVHLVVTHRGDPDDAAALATACRWRYAAATTLPGVGSGDGQALVDR